jgi:DNA-binding CsgD family transcriptional regulator
VPELSARERQVLELAATGLPNKLIARELGLSWRYVRNLLYLLYPKLGVHNRTEAARLLLLESNPG